MENASDDSRCLAPIVVGYLCIAAGACSWSNPDLEIQIHWRDSQPPALDQGMPLIYSGIAVGEVAAVLESPDGTTIRASVDGKYAHYIRTETTFVLASTTSGALFIEVIPLEKDAPPATDGAIFYASESYAEAKIRQLATDWKRTGLYLGLGAVLLFALGALVRFMFRVWVLFICVAVGLASAYSLSVYLAPHLGKVMPVDARPDLVSYVASFLLGYLACTIVLGLLIRPIKAIRV